MQQAALKLPLIPCKHKPRHKPEVDTMTYTAYIFVGEIYTPKALEKALYNMERTYFDYNRKQNKQGDRICRCP